MMGNLHKDRCSFGFGAALEADILLIAFMWMQKQIIPARLYFITITNSCNGNDYDYTIVLLLYMSEF